MLIISGNWTYNYVYNFCIKKFGCMLPHNSKTSKHILMKLASEIDNSLDKDIG